MRTDENCGGDAEQSSFVERGIREREREREGGDACSAVVFEQKEFVFFPNLDSFENTIASPEETMERRDWSGFRKKRSAGLRGAVRLVGGTVAPRGCSELCVSDRGRGI
ncbi:unnamed protein product [Linum trigynum]|uniref:Uncharacterized protein n=1 Tax=Linum trigynum TaxID=586398 RepID=A0AAV2GKI7_9ROSI